MGYLSEVNMSLKCFLIIISLLVCVKAKKSFTLVIDTTISMKEEIDVIKLNIGPVLHHIGNASSIENYIIVPFSDPDVGPSRVFTNPDKFIESIYSLRVSGGQDVPENSLSGVEKALQDSNFGSDIFLFTDACAKDEEKFRIIRDLCHSTRSRVIIFMSGSCPHFGRIRRYYDVAKVCFGNVFLFDPSNLRQAFNFIREITKDDFYYDVPAYEPCSSFTGSKQFPFVVDGVTRDVIVAVTGHGAVLQVYDESGQSPYTESLVVTDQTHVIKIVEPHSGLYQSKVPCQGETSVKIYKRSEFPFQIGFSSKPPMTIRETSSRPLPGQDNYILIVVPRIHNYQLKTMILHVLDGNRRQNLNLVEIRLNSGVYITQAYFEDRKPFQLTISGREANTNEDFRIMGKILDPQIANSNATWAAATVEIIDPESPLIDYEQSATVACKITGSPKPTIWWEDEEGQQMAAENGILEYPSTHISYLSMPSMRANRTVSCKASTLIGSDSKSIELFVYRPYVFQMIQIPKDSTFEYETKAKLYCEVQAYPEAEIKWYHDRQLLVSDNNDVNNSDEEELNTKYDYILEDNALIINNMSTKFTGQYTCEVRNEIKSESYTVTVNISGLESPEIEVEYTDITRNLGDDVAIPCRVIKGKPNPLVTWWYKSFDGFDFTNVSDDVIVEDNKLKISEVQSKNKGIYKCMAVNEQGQDSREVTLAVHYAPKIENSDTVTHKVIFEESQVELECSVDADPNPTVTWEKKQDDNTFSPLGSTYIIDESNSLRFTALSNDSGTYRCTAENEAGKAEKIAVVNVLVRPYITPVPELMTARVGGEVVLKCEVHASPAVTIVWKFTAPESTHTSTELFRGESLFRKDLHLTNLSKAQAGFYMCLVNNNVGQDRISITLVVV